MTIKVESTTEPVKAEAPKVEAPALDAKAPEQNDAAESETEAQEAKTEDKDDSEDSEPETDSDESDKEKPRKKGGFQRRIDKLNARHSAAQQELEYWKEQALKNAGETKKEPVVDSKPVVTEGKPNPDNYETHAEWAEALADWKVDQRLKERDQMAEKSKLEAEQANVLKSHTQRVKTFADKTADFQDVLTEVDDIPVSPAVQELIVTSENGPELMYELAKNRDEYARICKLSPLAAARELGRLESKLSGQAKESQHETKKTTKAPQPINPVGSKGGAVEKSIDDPNLSQREYEKLRAKQMKGHLNV